MGGMSSTFWQEKMISHLGNLSFDKALHKDLNISEFLTQKTRDDLLKKARNIIMLSLGD